MSYHWINPYEILNVSKNASQGDIRCAYKRLATNPSREIRKNACLAYDCFCNKEKYIQEGDRFRVKNKDCFYYTICGDLDSLKSNIENDKKNYI